MAMAMAAGMGANAQLADLAHSSFPTRESRNMAHSSFSLGEGRNGVHNGGMGDLDALLHTYEERIEFTENKGQLDPSVLFKADFPLGQALATREGMLLKAYDPAAVQARLDEGMRIEQEMHDGKPMRPLVWNEKGHGWMLHFQNALPSMRIESKDAHSEVNNYFIGGKEAHNVRTYQEVWYTGVYRGIDVRYYPAADGSLEYDVVCAPNSDPRAIAIEFKGIERLRVNDKGELVVPTSLGEISYPAPVVYQRIGGREKQVKASYRVNGSNVLGFTLGEYDKSQPLVIDPIAMRWSTWVNTNSSGDNHGHAIWVDPTDGAIYIVARVVGTTDNITVGAFDVTANGNLETIVGKYVEPAAVGGQGTRVWQTYIGGSGDDNPYAMEQGPDGALYITGQTSSTNFPLIGGSAFTGSSLNQQAQTDIDVFVLKITQDGQSIKAAVVGGNGADDNFDVRTAVNGDVFVCGSTTSTNLLTLNAGSGASNTTNGGSDALVFRINQDLSSLVWMRNYGGSSGDRASIMLHNPVSGDLFVGGNTSSTNFPTVVPRQGTRGGTSAGFLQRLTGAGATTWSSYFSSEANDDANLLCMEFNTTRTELYFGGVTEGLNAANVSASGVHDISHNGSNDFYVARMDINQSFLGGTYVGGTLNEVNMMGLNTDLNNDVYVFGYSNSTNFPVSASPEVPLQTTNNGSNDKVFFKLESDLSALEFSTYYGGTNDDYDPVGERGIKFNDCRIYTIVTAQSNNIPLTQGSLNTTKTSPTSRYEPGLVVWANPPDLLGNTINYLGTAICAGSLPGDITGSQPSYVLPTIVRNNTPSAYPSFGAAATFQWQTSMDSVNWTDIAGSTGQNLTGAEIGVLNQKTFIRRIIGGDACILAGAADQVVTVRIMSVTGDVTDAACNGASTGSITAIADGTGPFEYDWSNGQTTQTATGLAAGSYDVTVTDANGCEASNTFVVGQPTAVGGNANVTNATCGNSNGSATAQGSAGTGGYNFVWSTGAVGATLSNVPAGDYTVTITDANQCAFVLSVNIGGSGLPSANAGDNAVITCLNNGQVVLDGSSSTQGVTFSWSGPGIVSGGNTEDVTVNAAGTYTLTVLNPQTGCSSTDQAGVTLDNTAPGAQAAGGTLICTTLSVQLIGSGNGSFGWTGPNGFTSGDQNPTVSAAGTYLLTVTGANGCTSTANAVVELDNTVPGAQAAGGTLTCTTLSIQLSGSGNGSFSWSGPNGFTSGDQNPTVSAAGTYVLTITGANGCTSQDEAVVELDSTVPGAQAAGGTLTCTSLSVQLTGVGNGTYSWSGPNGFTSDDQNPTVSGAGTYVLTVTGANGCTSQDEAVVELDSTVPGTQAAGGTLTCTTLSVQLTGVSNGTYSWSGPNGFTSDDQNPTVSAAGTYVLTVTGANGCTSQASAAVELDITLPGAQASGGVLTCTSTSFTLLGSGNGTFSWTGPNGFTSTQQNPVVGTAGTYVLTVTGANGCTSQAEAVVEQDANVPGAQAVGGTLTCTLLSIELSGSGNGSYSWTGLNGFTSNDQNPTVSAIGTYVLTVTGTNGCTSQAEAVVELDSTVPGAQAAGGTLTCTTLSVQLTGVGSGDYSWTGPNSFTSNDQNPTVSAAGVYVLTVTGENGCTSQAEAVVELDNTVPGAQAAGGTLTCTTLGVQLTGVGNGSYSWSGPNGFTSNDQNPTVSAAGTYVLTVTGPYGCTSEASAVVELDNALPGAQAAGGVLTCANNSVTLSGSGNGSYVWSGPNGFSSTQQNPLVGAAGTYVLTVTGANGCTSQAEAVVEQDDNIPGAQAAGGTLTCTTLSVQLTGVGNGSYSWSGPNGFTSNDQNPTVTAAGTYVLTVTGANGCTSRAEVVVELDNTVPGAQAAGGTLTCTTTSVQLTGVGNGSFGWTGPNGYTSGQQNPVVGAAGTYVLTVTGTNGCTSVAEAVVEQDANVPGAQAVGGTLTCAVQSIEVSGVGNGSYSWTGPNGFTSTEQNPTVFEAGVYVLTVTGTNGCPSVAEAVVEQDANVPDAQAAGGTLTCTVLSVQLTGVGNGSYSWSGPNGFTSNDQNPTVSAAGTYVLTVTGANGCTSEAQAVVFEDRTPPVAIAYGGTITCDQSSVQLTGIGTGNLSWTGPNGSTSTDANPTVSEAGLYVLTVIGENGCSATATAEVVDAGGALEVSTQGGVVPCAGTGVLISASADGEVSYSWSGPEGFTATGAQVTVYVEGIYTVTAVADGGCSATVEVTVGKEECEKDCGPIISYCPQPMTVECGTDLNPDLIGYPVYRKDKDCPAVVYANYYDITSGYCPRTVTRYWTMSDATGATEYCTQVFIIVDTQAPVLYGVPENITVECGDVPGKDDGVWAEDGCQDVVDVYYCDAMEETENKCDYIITRTYFAMDYCGNLATSTQMIHVIDNSAPVFECELAKDIKVDCKDIPAPADCKAWDACDTEVKVLVDDMYGYNEETKACMLTRTYTAIDDCGNTATLEQTMILIGDCCDKPEAVKSIEVSVTPNPFRDQCVIAFEAQEEGTATIAIFDLNGRPVNEITVTGVTQGQQVRVPFSADAVEMGVYQYRVTIGSRTAAGRMIVQ